MKDVVLGDLRSFFLLRTSEARKGDGDNTYSSVSVLLCWLSILAQQPAVMWAEFLTVLSVIQIRGRWKDTGGGEGGSGRVERAKPEEWLKGGAVLRVTHSNTDLLEVQVGRSFTEVTCRFKTNHLTVSLWSVDLWGNWQNQVRSYPIKLVGNF